MHTHSNSPPCQGRTAVPAGDGSLCLSKYYMHGIVCLDPVTCCNACCTFVCWVSAIDSLQVLSRVLNHCTQLLFTSKMYTNMSRPKQSLLALMNHGFHRQQSQSTQLDHIKFHQGVYVKKLSCWLQASVVQAGLPRQLLVQLCSSASRSMTCAFNHVLPTKLEKDIKAESRIRKGAEALPPDSAVASCCMKAM